MGDRKTYKNRNAIPQNGDGGSASAATQRNLSGVPSVPDVQTSASGNSAAIAALYEFATRDDGWLRVVSQDHGKVVYYKWKYTSGPCQGRYCMFVDDVLDITGSVQGLLQKVHLCDVGVHQCVQDRFYQ